MGSQKSGSKFPSHWKTHRLWLGAKTQEWVNEMMQSSSYIMMIIHIGLDNLKNMKSWITWTAHPSIHPRLRHSTSFHFGQRCLCQGTLQLCNDLALQEWFSLRNYLLKAMGVDTSRSILNIYYIYADNTCACIHRAYFLWVCAVCTCWNSSIRTLPDWTLLLFFSRLLFSSFAFASNNFCSRLACCSGVSFSLSLSLFLVFAVLRTSFLSDFDWDDDSDDDLDVEAFFFSFLLSFFPFFPRLPFFPFFFFFLSWARPCGNYKLFRHHKRMQWIWDRL